MRIYRSRALTPPLILLLLVSACWPASRAGAQGGVGAPAAPACAGKTPPEAEYFSVDDNYAPSGKMGDVGDLHVSKREGSTVFEYGPEGREPHEWEYKYVGGKLNPAPARFGGVMYLDPPNNFGTRCGGFDLRKFRRAVEWRARSLEGPVNVEFIIGGVEWVWDEERKARVASPFPDSMPRVSLGTKLVTPQWQDFTYQLSARPPADFARVVAAFAWVIAERPPGRASPERPKPFVIELSGIRYVR